MTASSETYTDVTITRKYRGCITFNLASQPRIPIQASYTRIPARAMLLTRYWAYQSHGVALTCSQFTFAGDDTVTI